MFQEDLGTMRVTNRYQDAKAVASDQEGGWRSRRPMF